MDFGELKAQLSVPGKKINMQFDTSTRKYFEEEAGLTEEEIQIFQMRAKGYSIQKIACEMSKSDKYFCKGTIERRISSIKAKILNIL